MDKIKDDIDEKLQRLNSKLMACRKVIETLKTPGWQDIIQPILDRMITDVIGGRNGDFWDSGQIKRDVLKEFRVENMLGYRQGLIDLHNRVWSYKSQIKNIEGQIQRLGNSEPRDIQPMQGGRYAPEVRVNG